MTDLLNVIRTVFSNLCLKEKKNRGLVLPARLFISLCHLVPLVVSVGSVEHHLFSSHEAAMLANELTKCESSQFTVDVAQEELPANSFQN